MTSRKKGAEKAKRLADIAGVGQAFEGDKVTLAEIKGQEVEVLDFKFLKSAFREGEYVTMQLRMGGELKMLNTEAQVVMNAFRNTNREDLPALVTFVQRTAEASGRTYWTME